MVRKTSNESVVRQIQESLFLPCRLFSFCHLHEKVMFIIDFKGEPGDPFK